MADQDVAEDFRKVMDVDVETLVAAINLVNCRPDLLAAAEAFKRLKAHREVPNA